MTNHFLDHLNKVDTFSRPTKSNTQQKHGRKIII